MKKLLCVVICITAMLCGCSPVRGDESREIISGNDYITGVWITYSELSGMLESQDFTSQIELCAQNCKSMGITDVFLHVRAFCDSLYKSQYFPQCSYSAGYDFDVFSYIIDLFHLSGIRVHAWINPYRVRLADEDVSTLPQESPAYKWLNDESEENNGNVCISGGIYLNPASFEVRELIINGIREIISNYDVDGIHFDDYFYPTTEPSFDETSYNIYRGGCENPLTLEQWRIANVNALISGSYTAVKFMNKDICFSISPAASISKNYTENYADVSAWCKSGCVDIIIPQLYFGFEYPLGEYRFENLLKQWKGAVGSTGTRLVVGLASYKVGTENEPDNIEWNQSDDLLLRQAQICEKDEAVSGHIFFSYSSLFATDEKHTNARKLLENHSAE